MPKIKRNKELNFQLAIHLDDLDRIDSIIRQKMFKDRLNLVDPVTVNDGVALAFSCSLLTAATLADIIRSEDRKAGDMPTRIYLRNGSGNWEAVPKNAIFTVTVKGNIHLNPGLFCVQIPQEPPCITRVTFGGK